MPTGQEIGSNMIVFENRVLFFIAEFNNMMAILAGEINPNFLMAIDVLTGDLISYSNLRGLWREWQDLTMLTDGRLLVHGDSGDLDIVGHQ